MIIFSYREPPLPDPTPTPPKTPRLARSRPPKMDRNGSNGHLASSLRRGLRGPVLRDTARLSQRYRAVGFLVSQHGQLGSIPPPPFSERFPLGEVEVRYPPPPQKGYLSDTFAIPYENKANGCDTPLCDTISKRYCKRYGGVSRTGPLRGGGRGEGSQGRRAS